MGCSSPPEVGVLSRSGFRTAHPAGAVRELSGLVGRRGLEPPASAVIGSERCATRSKRPSVTRGVIRPESSLASPGYPSLVQWGAGPTPQPRPDPVTVNVQLP